MVQEKWGKKWVGPLRKVTKSHLYIGIKFGGCKIRIRVPRKDIAAFKRLPD
jgi:hypothetical protein